MIAGLACLLAAAPGFAANVVQVRVGNHPTFTRVVFELDAPAGYRIEKRVDQGTPELIVTLEAASAPRSVRSGSPEVDLVAVQHGTDPTVAHIRLRRANAGVKELILSNPPRIVIDLMRDPSLIAATRKPAAKPAPAKAPAAKPAEAKPAEPKPAETLAKSDKAKPAPSAPAVAPKELAVAKPPAPEPKPPAPAVAPKSEAKTPAPGPKPAEPPAVARPEAKAPPPLTPPMPEVKPPEPVVTARPAPKPPEPAPKPEAKPTPIPAPTPVKPPAPPELAKPMAPELVKPEAPELAKPTVPELAKPGAPELAKPELPAIPSPAPAEKPPAPKAPAESVAKPRGVEPSPASGGFALAPMQLAALAGGVLLLVLLVVMLMRRRRLPNDLDVTTLADEDEAPPISEGLDFGAGTREAASTASRRPPERAPAPPVTAPGGLFADADQDLFDTSEKGESKMSQDTLDLPVSRSQRPAATQATVSTGGDSDVGRLVRELERRVAQLETRLDEANDARERLERQVAAQSEELRVQRAAIARTQRALRGMNRGEEEQATEPALRDPNRPMGGN